ncbi:MAG TPA: ABC transporter permease [Pyrinomonadaceae bacterium]
MDTNWKIRMNPEILRSLRVTLPPRRVLFITIFTIILVHIVGGIFWNDAAARTGLMVTQQIKQAGSATYWVFMLVLFALLFVLGPATAALSFIQEKIRGTSIFQQMVLLSPFKLAVGKFVGSGLIGYFVAALIFPFFVVTALIGEVNFEQFVWVSLFLLIGGLCCQSVGLFISSALSGPGERFLRGGLLVGPVVGGLGALLAFALYGLSFPHYFSDYERWHFYGVGLTPHIVVLALMIFTGAWAFVGTVRRIKVSQLIPLRPWPTWLFFASAEAVLTGLLWAGFSQHDDGRFYLFPPIARLGFYLFLNWAALMILAGSSALSRGRLREWWSAGCDQLALVQRQEIKNALTTFVVALTISLTGLTALWASFHTYVQPLPQILPDIVQLSAIALSFTLTVAGMVVFIQYCAMQRFRIGAWAGVTLTITFYIIMGIVAASVENKKSTAALLNPLVYATVITEGDPFMNRQDTYGAAHGPNAGQAWSALAHGLIAQGVLAISCFGLAYVKWRQTEEEILRESA